MRVLSLNEDLYGVLYTFGSFSWQVSLDLDSVSETRLLLFSPT